MHDAIMRGGVLNSSSWILCVLVICVILKYTHCDWTVVVAIYGIWFQPAMEKCTKQNTIRTLEKFHFQWRQTNNWWWFIKNSWQWQQESHNRQPRALHHKSALPHVCAHSLIMGRENILSSWTKQTRSSGTRPELNYSSLRYWDCKEGQRAAESVADMSLHRSRGKTIDWQPQYRQLVANPIVVN